MSSLTCILNKCYFNKTEQNLVSLQTECFQSLNCAGTRVCRPDLVTWLFGWSDMLPPRTTITASSGLSLGRLPKVFSVKVGVAGFGTFTGIAGDTGLLPTLLSVVAGCLIGDSRPSTVLEVVWEEVGTDLSSVLGAGGSSLVPFGRRCSLVLWYSLPFISTMYVLGSL